jgi:hypothetical protein
MESNQKKLKIQSNKEIDLFGDLEVLALLESCKFNYDMFVERLEISFDGNYQEILKHITPEIINEMRMANGLK